MTKSTTGYWNALSPEKQERWTSIKGMEGMAEELTLSIDDVTGWSLVEAGSPGKRNANSRYRLTGRRLTASSVPGSLKMHS